MKKVLFTLTAVLALTVASKFITVQAEEMAAESPETVIENMINEAVVEMNVEMNEVVDLNEVNDLNEVIEMNEVVEDAGAAADVAQ